MTDREIILDYLRENLSEKRYTHILGVEEMAYILGDIFNVEKKKIMYVSLLHDISKEMPDEWQIKNLRTQGIDEDSYKKETWHSFTAKCIYKGLLNIDNEEIDKAIEVHTVCDYNMSDLAKILFVADFIEENRKFDEARLLREQIHVKSLNELVILKLNYVKDFLNDKQVTDEYNDLIKHYGG